MIAHHRFAIVATLVLLAPLGAASQSAPDVRDAAASIVARIQRADYEGDRPALSRLYDEMGSLKVSATDPRLGSRIQYWRGFALWRRALNGFSAVGGSPDPNELQRDLERALRDFEDAASQDSTFVDAKAGAISCLGNLAFLGRKDPARVQNLTSRTLPLIKESLAAAPENPRLLWVMGAQQMNTPPEYGGGRELALATYEKGLRLAREQKGRNTDPLEPSWGEPELLMSLAGASLRQVPPNVAAAESYAEQALALVPYWRSVREGLIPRIQKAKAKE